MARIDTHSTATAILMIGGLFSGSTLAATIGDSIAAFLTDWSAGRFAPE